MCWQCTLSTKSALLISMEFKCIYCGRVGVSKSGHNYHQAYCIKNPSRLLCAPKTQRFYDAMKTKKRKNQYTEFDWTSVPFECLSPSKRRQRLLQESGHKCSECGYNKTRTDGGSILEIDHIDGNHTNNAKDNLRVLCPNCHALTPNYKNWGRSGKEKTSTRQRKGNAGYKELQELLRTQTAERDRQFIEEILQFHSSGDIDFKLCGWTVRVSEKLGMSPHIAVKRIKTLMPEFYKQNCRTKNGTILDSLPVSC